MYLGFHYYGIMLPFTQFMDGPISKPKFQTTASIYLMCETLSVPQLESSMSWNHHNLHDMGYIRSRRWGCLVTWFCYQMIAKPGNKTAAPSWPDSYVYCFWHCWSWPSVTCIFCKIAFIWMPQGHILITVGSGNGLVMPGNKPLL